jgi:hypothetical protein
MKTKTAESYFNRADAEELLWRRVRTKVEFSGVPKDTAGAVVRVDTGSYPERYTVGIQWDLPGRAQPLVDWFTRDEYQRFLEQV